VLHLGLTENGFNNDGQLAVVRYKVWVLLLVAFFALQLTITEHETAQLFALFLIIVRRDLIKPQTHMLVIILAFLSLIKIGSGLITDLLNKSVFLLEPTFPLLIIVMVVVIVVGGLVLIHFPVVTVVVVHAVVFSGAIVAARHVIFFHFIKALGRPELPQSCYVKQRFNRLDFFFNRFFLFNFINFINFSLRFGFNSGRRAVMNRLRHGRLHTFTELTEQRV
jgi:hypothetical protein